MTSFTPMRRDFRLRLEILRVKGSDVKSWGDLKERIECRYAQKINYAVFVRAVTHKLTTKRGDDIRKMADEVLSELEREAEEAEHGETRT